MRSAWGSSPRTVTIRTSSPSSAMLWAMFRPTPPRLIWTRPGFESPDTREAWEKPPMSTLTPPTTAAKLSVGRM